MAATDSVSVERIRALFDYSPETGEFTRKVKTGRSTVVGEIVGSPAKNGYLRITVDEVRLYAHRAAFAVMNDSFPVGDVDHIDGDRQNNAWSNLREATRAQNMQNERKARAGNKSGLAGAHWHAKSGKWTAAVKTDGAKKHLGIFDTAEQAHLAYVSAKRELHAFSTV